MHTNRGEKWLLAIHLLATLLITPFLLFPTQLVAGTLLALIGVALIWLFPPQAVTWPQLPELTLNKALLLFALTLFVGVLVSADPDLTLGKAAGLLLGLTVWLVTVRHVRHLRQFDGVSGLFVLMGLGFTAVGILSADWLFKIPLFNGIIRQIPQLNFLIPEAPTDGVQTNQIASTILIWLPLLYAILLGHLSRSRPIRSFWIGVTLLISIVGTFLLLLTQSRSGYIGYFGGLFLLLLGWRQLLSSSGLKRWLTGVLVAGVLSVTTAVIILGPQRLAEIWRDPVQDSLVGNLGTIGFRQEVWRWALAASRDFLFTGTGLGTFRVVVRRFYPIRVATSYDIAHAHNIFLQTILDLGIFGLISYIAILIIVGWMGWRVARERPKLRPYALGLLAGIASLHIFGLTDALALGAKPGLLFWLAIGLITAMFITIQPESLDSVDV